MPPALVIQKVAVPTFFAPACLQRKFTELVVEEQACRSVLEKTIA